MLTTGNDPAVAGTGLSITYIHVLGYEKLHISEQDTQGVSCIETVTDRMAVRIANNVCNRRPYAIVNRELPHGLHTTDLASTQIPCGSCGILVMDQGTTQRISGAYQLTRWWESED